MRLLFKGGTVIDPAGAGVAQMDVLLDEGVIADVAPDMAPSGARVIDCSGKHLFPGFIDLHTHLREPGNEEAETIATGAKAAVYGGFTTVVAMPNTNPPTDSPELVRFVIRRAAEAKWADVLPAGTMSENREGKQLAQMALMAEEGAVLFTDDGDWVADGSLMMNGLAYAAGMGLLVASHCEEPSLKGRAVCRWGPVSVELGLRAAPGEVEEIAIMRDLALARLTGAGLHIHHLSTAGGARALPEARAAGVKVTAEVTPHHLIFNNSVLKQHNPLFRVSPPLGDESDRETLVGMFAGGEIEALATDHAPHTLFAKSTDFSSAPPGMTGLQTAFSAVHTHLVEKERLTLERLVDSLTASPARILGLTDRGSIKPGMRGDLALFDLSSRWKVEKLVSRAQNNPFMGEELSGVVCAVTVAGELKYERK